MSKAWKIDELIRKYPIKNIWEWKFTGNTISSTVRLHDIKEDPWNRSFDKSNFIFLTSGCLLDISPSSSGGKKFILHNGSI